MQEDTIVEKQTDSPGLPVKQKIRVAAYLIGALLLFLFSINLMVASLHNMGATFADTILLATSNPFTGLFIGLLVTALLQSSSTSTSLVVAFVASGAITVDGAFPIIMGANIGTTITSTIVSLGFINKKKEFKRAVAAGTYHDFFNILTALVLFPLEYYYRFLTQLSTRITEQFFGPFIGSGETQSVGFSFGLAPLITFLNDLIPSVLVLVIISFIILFGSILLFRKIVSNLLHSGRPETFSRFFFRNGLKSFGWGIVTTAAIRSSTITTSLVVPIVAKKIVSLRQAAPFILGANLGTTITAFIAILLNAYGREATIIAVLHFLFNFFGVLIFFPIPYLRKIPMMLANGLGVLTLKYRLVGFVYLLSTFFMIPFMLIYFNQDAVQTYKLVYEKDGGESYYRVNVRMNTRTLQGEWIIYPGRETRYRETPSSIQPVTVKKQTLFVGNDILLFNRVGYCWDTENKGEAAAMCVADILPKFSVGQLSYDSVYVFRLTSKGKDNPSTHWYYYSSLEKILLLHEVEYAGERSVLEKLISAEGN